MLCKYRDIFGRPGEGTHAYRIFWNFAAVDIVMTILGAIVLSYVTKIRFWHWFVLLMLIAIILHRLFCVNTRLNVLIFGRV